MQLQREGEAGSRADTRADTRPAVPPVRRATPADAAALAAVAGRLFRETYGPAGDPSLAGGSRPEDVAAYVDAHFTPACQGAELADPTLATLLVEDAPAAATGGGPTIVAYAQVRAPSPHAAAGPAAAEIARFYVDASWQGRGVADALMGAVVVAAAAAGAPALWLAVYARNARAVAFYRRHGFRVAGTSTFRLGAEVQDDWIMTRER
jgi:ribosomal protein S18 acetylase RimI-like enzyme